MATAVMQVLHSIDDDYAAELKAEIFAAVGNLDHIEVWGQEILVGGFIRPTKSRGGIILDGTTMADDDKWQSKSCLILKVGSGALPAIPALTDPIKQVEAMDAYNQLVQRKWGGRVPQVGDWVYGNVQEHFHLNIRGPGAESRKNPDGSFYRKKGENGWPCRMVLIGDIRGRTTRPQDIM